MIEFEALKANSLEEALDILAEKKKEVRMVAGGTDMLVQIHHESDDLKGMEYLLDISSIPGLDLIEDNNEYLKIGALCTHSEIMDSVLVNEKFPILKKAAEVIGSTQIRNRGTVGGNINNASPAADLVTALIALDASVVLHSKHGKRELSLSEFITGPYMTDRYEDEILTEVKVPYIQGEYFDCYQKVKRRQAVAIARINLAVITKLKDNKFDDIRIAFGSATPTAMRFREIEAELEGSDLNKIDYDKLADETGQAMVNITGERWSTPYKRPVVGNLLKRALQSIVKEVQ
ncbi:MAG TPA: xanthine dehydrogenase family protein subunit M [Halanaerobiales bacterium]|nr:xanthine dehydrogenase family protein subunit M [Halanaerobiales bacterium]